MPRSGNTQNADSGRSFAEVPSPSGPTLTHAMYALPRDAVEQTTNPPAVYAPIRRASSCLNHGAAWFQLVKMRLTK